MVIHHSRYKELQWHVYFILRSTLTAPPSLLEVSKALHFERIEIERRVARGNKLIYIQ